MLICGSEHRQEGERMLYRVGHLKSRVHKSKDIIVVTGLQANYVINDIVHLELKNKQITHTFRVNHHDSRTCAILLPMLLILNYVWS